MSCEPATRGSDDRCVSTLRPTDPRQVVGSDISVTLPVDGCPAASIDPARGFLMSKPRHRGSSRGLIPDVASKYYRPPCGSGSLLLSNATNSPEPQQSQNF